MYNFLKKYGKLIILAFLFILWSGDTVCAATVLDNDNHTDTADYCLRAYDVSMNLSEFTAMSESEWKAEIIGASNFVFLIWNSAPGYSNWISLTSGYTVDFSTVAASATTDGYVITVTLPQITVGLDSIIQFRLFVIGDTPSADPSDSVAPIDPADPVDPVDPVDPDEPPEPTEVDDYSEGLISADSDAASVTKNTSSSDEYSVDATPLDAEDTKADETLAVADSDVVPTAQEGSVFSAIFVVDLLLGTVLLTLTCIFSASVLSDVRVLRWYRQQKKKRSGGTV